MKMQWSDKAGQRIQEVAFGLGYLFTTIIPFFGWLAMSIAKDKIEDLKDRHDATGQPG